MSENEIQQSEKEVIAALIESNDDLQEELSRVRRSHKILRTVISALRKSVESYKSQLETARFNDETFKAFCNGEFDAPVAATDEGGLPESAGVVESTVMNGEEASAPNTSS